MVTYDRRGRGESGDNKPYAVEREIEDIEALIDEVGKVAYLYGVSSGGCLALETAIKLGDKVKKIAIYEAPYKSDNTAPKNGRNTQEISKSYWRLIEEVMQWRSSWRL